MCRLQALDSPSTDSHTSSSSGRSRSARSAKKKPGANNRRAKGETKYGVEVPLNWARALELDKETNTTF